MIDQNGNSGREPQPRDHPLWETLVMAASFVLLWAWLLSGAAIQGLGNNKSALAQWPGWSVLQVIAMLALVVIMVRRVKRLKRAMEENSGPPGFPFMPMNGNRPDEKRKR